MKFTVLQCKHFKAPYSTQINKRIVQDYELDLFLGEEREIYVDNVKYYVHRGDICFRRPGQSIYGIGEHDAYMLTLDFSNRERIKGYSRNTAKVLQPIYDSDILNDIPTVFSPCNIEKFQYLFFTLLMQLDYETDVSKALVMEIIYRLNAEIKRNFFKENALEPTAADKVAQYIHMHYAESITLETLSKVGCLDRSYLVRSFKKRYNRTPIDYLIKVRLNNARDLLLDTDLSIAEIAESCGYNNESFFISQYKNKFGKTPAQHRKSVEKTKVNEK